MKKILILVACVATLFTACQKQGTECVSFNDEGASVIFDIVGMPTTTFSKAGDSEVQTADEKKVSILHIGVYDAEGKLEKFKDYTDDRTQKRQVITGLTEGKKTIVAIANLQDALPQTYAELEETVFDLASNTPSNLIMCGTVDEEAKKDPQAEILKLNRVCAKFEVLGTISTAWEGDEPTSFSITDIYIANASIKSNIAFSGSLNEYVNPRTSTTLVEKKAYTDLLVSHSDSWQPGDAFNNGVCFYSFPNSSTTTRTAIIIKGKYEGKDTYYPIPIDENIVKNTLYRVGDITITCQGVDNPWDVFTKIKLLYNIEIVDWDTKDVDFSGSF